MWEDVRGFTDVPEGCKEEYYGEVCGEYIALQEGAFRGVKGCTKGCTIQGHAWRYIKGCEGVYLRSVVLACAHAGAPCAQLAQPVLEDLVRVWGWG